MCLQAPTLEARKAAFGQSLAKGTDLFTFMVSYVGQWKYQALGKHIVEFWTHVPAANNFLVEIAAVKGSIFLSFHQRFEEDKYRPNISSKEMGYSLAKGCWGNGYMTEAAKRLIRYGFEELKLDVLMIRTSETNRRSQRVIEKCGFTYEGTLRRAYRMYDNNLREVRCYSMLREEYENLYLE